MEINGIFDCKLLNKGCGNNNNKRAKLDSFDSKNSGGATLSTDDNGEIEIVAIDSLDIREKIAFIKIDTEGFEKDVISGAIKTIARDKPFMMIEIAKNNLEDIIHQLSELGYKFEMYDKENVFFYDPPKIELIKRVVEYENTLDM